MEAEAQFLQAKFLQGVYSFEGRGLEWPFQLTDELFYEVPLDKHAQLLYFRAGNSTDEMIYVMLMQNGRPKRYFPIGARADSHVTLAITEDIEPGSRFEVFIAAPRECAGWIVIDIGLMEF
jgi:assimilatory nitrate reductase catalytic subunit